jgi:hypothetical protein
VTRDELEGLIDRNIRDAQLGLEAAPSTRETGE